MSENTKTGTFLGVAAASILIATIVAWPTTTTDENVTGGPIVGEELFPEFKDPLTAASLKIVDYDEELGQLKDFEVLRDKQSGRWKIASNGYPADAVEHMRDAANAMVGLKALDTPTDNREDHSGMGVVEPKPDELNVEDEGVGRLVTFKDENQQVLASLIIGDQVKGTDNQVYVRKPGQDLVYAVQLDDKPLSTKFRDWIEEDLLQLSSIDIEEVGIKDYSFSIGLQGPDFDRKYEATVKKDASQWDLLSLKEYEKGKLEPNEVEVGDDEKLNTTKLNQLGNALDDLKFVEVRRKPEGISANLRADKDFDQDRDTTALLARRGFYPVTLTNGGPVEILSANGELTATTKEGVTYLLRFGNVEGISEEEDGEDGEEGDEEAGAGGLNRYLMVSTSVDESRFPAPELEPIPQTLEDLDKLDNPEPPPGTVFPAELNDGVESKMEEAPKGTSSEDESKADEKKENSKADESAKGDDESDAKSEDDEKSEKADDKAASEDETSGKEMKEEAPEDTKAEEPENKESSDDEAKEADGSDESKEAKDTDGASDESSGETDASGEGEATTVGEAQAETESEAGEEASADEEGESTNEASEEEKEDADAVQDGESTKSDKPAKSEDSEEVEETEEEKLERLAAVQEKITKENERKLDERKDKVEAAKRQSRELNDRFADWYYVIPEETYAKLRISRDDLFDSSDGPANPAAGGPSIPGLPPGMPGGFGN